MDLPPLPTPEQRLELQERLGQLRARAEALRKLDPECAKRGWAFGSIEGRDACLRFDNAAEAARLDAEATKVLILLNSLEKACDEAEAAAAAVAAESDGSSDPAVSEEDARRRANFEALGVARARLSQSPAERELRRLRLRASGLLHDATARLDRALDAAPCPARDPPGPKPPFGGLAEAPCRNTAARLPALPSLAEAWAATKQRSRRQAAARRALASGRLQLRARAPGQS